jgi:sarcosine oxidase subunit beta
MTEDALPSRCDVLVVGGGVIGAAVQDALATRDVTSVLLDRGRYGIESTGKSAAIVRMHYSHPDVIRMAVVSRDALRELSATASQPFYHETGWFFLVPPEARSAALAGAAEVREGGAVVAELSPNEAREAFPALNTDGVDLVLHEPQSGYCDPIVATEGLLERAARKGAQAHSGVRVRSLLREGDRIVGVETDAGSISCSTVVLAAGPWSKKLAATAGVELPLTITREQDLLVSCPEEDAPPVAISNMVDSIYLRPLMDGDRRCGAIIGRGFPKEYEEVDPDDYDGGLDDWFEADVRERATRRFGRLGSAAKTHGRSGLYCVTPDWQPIVGPMPGIGGLVLATGGSGHCFKLAPAIGEMVAAQMVGGTPSHGISADQFSIDRFTTGSTFGSRYGGNRG